MEQFYAIPKKWGNSIGITIPADVIKQEHVKPQKKVVVLIIGDTKKKLKAVFGSLQLKKKTQQVMDEIDKGYNEH